MTKTLTLTAFLPFLLSIAGPALARPAVETGQCVLSDYASTSVVPLHAEENVGYGTYSLLRGAQFFVPARDGLTAQWLTLQVERGLSANACRPGVGDVSVQVVAANDGFWVQLSAARSAKAADLLHWAKDAVQPARRDR